MASVGEKEGGGNAGEMFVGDSSVDEVGAGDDTGLEDVGEDGLSWRFLRRKV